MKSIALVFTSILIFWTQAFTDDSPYYEKDGRFLEGYDPVSYTQQGGPQKGSPQWTSTLGSTQVLFANAANKALFDATPEKWIPAYNGYCAYAMADDKLYKVDPKNFKIIDGKTHLFYENFFVDTQKKWNKSEGELKKRADSHWSQREKK